MFEGLFFYQVKTKEENEVAAIQHFKGTVKVNDNGRYEIRLPWVESRGNLGISKTAAEKSLKSVTLKLLNENKFEDYENVFNFWESTGIIESISYGHSDVKFGYYLPHRAVTKDNSST